MTLIESFVESGLRHALLGAMLVVAAAGFGILSFQSVPADVFPDLSTPVFNLIVQDPSMAPEELETQIAIPRRSAISD